MVKNSSTLIKGIASVLLMLLSVNAFSWSLFSNEKGVMCAKAGSPDKPQCYLLIDADNKTVKGHGYCHIKKRGVFNLSNGCTSPSSAGTNDCPEWYEYKKRTISVNDGSIRFGELNLIRENLVLDAGSEFLYCEVEEANKVKKLVRKKTKEYKQQKRSRNKI